MTTTTTPACDFVELERLPDTPTSPADAPTIGDVINRRLGRRGFLKGALATTALVAVPSVAAVTAARPASAATPSFGFAEVARGVDRTHHVAPGHDARVLIRWGDPVLQGAPEFDPMAQTPEKQLAQFGYNCDFVGFLPLPQGATAADRGLLWVNHEYTIAPVMFPGLVPPGMDRIPLEMVERVMTKQIVDIEMAAHGGTIVEVVRGKDGTWTYLKDSTYNRRITALTTEFAVTGPAAGHRRMRTGADPQGVKIVGMVNNCAGGVTPWGTFLTCEENFDSYFTGRLDQSHPEQRNYDRYGVPGQVFAWGLHHARFDVEKEPNEANRFGWVVEVDPYDPASTPRKHTALGRFKHEGAGVIVNKDGRVVVYMGDDQRFEHVYRFVSKNRFDPADRAANMRLLEEGTLSVARYDEDGTLTWLPLVHGQGPLTAANGFRDQGDVVINVRQAATLLGATRMDRPEDVEVNPKTHKVYAMLTNNEDRRPADWDAKGIPATEVNGPNPRAFNIWGHIVEMTPPDQDHTAEKYTWEMLIQAGNPADPATAAVFNAATTADGWFSCPDNCAIDHQGRLWIATDQGNNWPLASGSADGLWALETEGPARGTAKAFFRVPVGAELCGPCFTPDDTALFLAVQHPGTDGVAQFLTGGAERSTFENPATRWPDFKEGVPPRPSVVVVTKQGGGAVGT